MLIFRDPADKAEMCYASYFDHGSPCGVHFSMLYEVVRNTLNVVRAFRPYSYDADVRAHEYVHYLFATLMLAGSTIHSFPTAEPKYDTIWFRGIGRSVDVNKLLSTR